MEEPLVIINCLVYNHEPYLRQCLDGFVMQQTTFPFYAVVHDDASTDKSADIIREYEVKYPEIIRPIYETENQWSKKDGSLRRIMNDACRPAKYIAYCEGDDYWTDPLKLQKQVDILEADESITLVYSDFHIVHAGKEASKEERAWHDRMIKRAKSGNLFRPLLHGNFVFTCTTCYRTNVLLSDYIQKASIGLDYLTSLVSALLGNAVYLPEKTATYRIGVGLIANKYTWVQNISNQVWFYVVSLFLSGEGKFTPIQRFCINTQILSVSLKKSFSSSDKQHLRKVLKLKRSLYFYLPFAAIDYSFYFFQRKLKKLFL